MDSRGGGHNLGCDRSPLQLADDERCLQAFIAPDRARAYARYQSRCSPSGSNPLA